MSSHSNNPIDRVVGRRLRERREEVDLTREQLGTRIDASTETVAGYEGGTLRLDPATMFVCCQALDVTVAYFLADIPVARSGV